MLNTFIAQFYQGQNMHTMLTKFSMPIFQMVRSLSNQAYFYFRNKRHIIGARAIV